MEVFVILFIFFAFVTVIGHGIWVLLAWFFRTLLGSSNPSPPSPSINSLEFSPSDDLAATARTVERWRVAGRLDPATYRQFRQLLEPNRPTPATPLNAPTPGAWADAQKTHPTPPAPVTALNETALPSTPSPVNPTVADVFNTPTVTPAPAYVSVTAPQVQPAQSVSAPPTPEKAEEPRRTWGESLAAFMEQGNIRWGEIIGGLLIIGCSTALTVSLWGRISQVPALKFFIFTAVTAALFGIGLYTEHRWKLPTTSHGLLTIAVLLVPLNFLAIAAVSGEGAALIVLSEAFAPALFLFLVYRAGRVLTPDWSWLLAFGVLGSSVGQLLVRHFAEPSSGLPLLFALGAFPLISYLALTLVMLRRADADDEITQPETVSIFITLGALTFAAVLPFGLLLYKSGAASATLMRLAPLATLYGVPALACGLLLWRRITTAELNAERIAGTSIALAGGLLAVLGVVWGWPNPASVALAALGLGLIATTTARYFAVPHAHTVAALALSLAYLLIAQGLLGNIAWQVAPDFGLLDALNNVRSGQVLALLFVGWLVVAEIITRRVGADLRVGPVEQESVAHWADTQVSPYLLAAGAVMAVSVALLALHGLRLESDPHGVAFFYALYAVGAGWIAWRRDLPLVTWLASGLAMLAFMQILTAHTDTASPWQAAWLLGATLAATGAILAERHGAQARRIFTEPLTHVTLLGSVAALVVFFQAWEWQSVALVAARLWWLVVLAAALVWLRREANFLYALQLLMVAAVAVTVKNFLGGFAWYTALPHATLHPRSLQIHGSALLLLCLAWLAVRRLAAGSRQQAVDSESELATAQTSALSALPPLILVAFVALAVYGAWSGVKLELTRRTVLASAWNIGGFPHESALEIGSWVVMILLGVTFWLSYRERSERSYLLAIITVSACAVPLLAGLCEPQFATATAWRWLSAIGFVVGQVVVWRQAAGSKQQAADGEQAADSADNPQSKLRNPQWENPQSAIRNSQSDETAWQWAWNVGRWCYLLPLLALTVYPAWRAMYYDPVHSPTEGIFAVISPAISYSVPLLLIALGLAFGAVRQRAASAAFAAALALLLAVNVAHVFALSAAQALMDRVALAQAAQWNALVAAGCALLWLGTRARWRPDADDSAYFLRLLLGFAAFINLLLVVPIVVRVVLEPTWTSIGTYAVGSVFGWLALLATGAAIIWYGQAYRAALNAYAVCATLCAGGVLAAAGVARLDAGREWYAYHVLMLACVVVAWLMVALRDAPRWVEASAPPVRNYLSRLQFGAEWSRTATHCVWTLSACAVALALWQVGYAPHWTRWTNGALVAIAVLCAVMNAQTGRRGYLYPAAALLNVAATITYLAKYANQKIISEGELIEPKMLELVAINIFLLALPALIWLWLERRAQRWRTAGALSQEPLPPAHSTALLLCFILLPVLPLTAWFAVELLRWEIIWAAVSAVVLLIAVCLRVGESYAVLALYGIGATMLGLAVDKTLGVSGLREQLPAKELNLLSYWFWAMVLGGALYALATSLVWRRRVALMNWLARAGVPPRKGVPDAENIWLRVTNLIIVWFVALFAMFIVFTYQAAWLRGTIALAVAAQLFTFGLLAQRVKVWQCTALAFGTLGAVLLGWAWLGPKATWLDYAVSLMLTQLVVVPLLAVLPVRLTDAATGWQTSAQTIIKACAFMGLASLAFVLGDEIEQQVRLGAVNITRPMLLLVALTLLAACVMALVVALRGELDPLKLPETRRTAYVYAAEVLLVLLFVHLRLTAPEFFGGRLARYWPYLVIALAYVGVALSEMLKRQQVLAAPLLRTGVFLPLLPVLGYWFVSSQANFAWLMFAIGGLYGGLAIVRKSWLYGALAMLAAQIGGWHALSRTDGLGFAQHPQLWLIPAALCVLLAAHLNRDRLDEAQTTAVRYGALGLIYVSSTADIFLNGVAEAPWLPLVLMAWSVMGVFVGIWLRIRAFLWLGLGFTLIAVLTMVYYASANLGWTWIWYVTGIFIGATIIFIFALFEKKKTEMLRVVNDLRAWEN